MSAAALPTSLPLPGSSGSSPSGSSSWSSSGYVVFLMVVFWIVAVLWAATARIADPEDLAFTARRAPVISLERIRPYAGVDPVSFASGEAHVAEFSRAFQAAFILGRRGGMNTDTAAGTQLEKMHRARRGMHRDFHSLRMTLPNDARANAEVVRAILETDAVMAGALETLVDRFPRLRLVRSAGIVSSSSSVLAVDDTWE